MTVNLFDQFMTPKLLFIPLIFIAMFLPVLLLYPSNRLFPNRATTIQSHLMMMTAKQLMLPISTPGHTWTLLLTTALYYLALNNLLGLLPYTFTPTTQLALNISLSLPMWLAIVALGLRKQPTKSLAHLLPMVTPKFLIPFMIMIESVSLFIRPLALAVRLTANITAGHMLIMFVSYTVLTLITSMTLTATLAFVLLLLLTLLELAVALIQAYVFAMLLSLYLQENT
uniref:ATP synthase subunit a n=1 Tax=Phelsuma guimbeaui TaxID=232314 RepID=A0A0A1H9U9_9SAUR|nr:ATPase subunit 6 [Phelsuma guimbeaui]